MAQKKKKASVKKPAVAKAGENHLTTADVEHLKQALLVKRRQLIGDVNEMHDEALRMSRLDASGDLSSMPIHMADIGTDNYEQEFVLDLMDSERKMLHAIDDALQRIHLGSYGTCEATKKPISKARLEAKPWARFCVEHARKLEKGSALEQ